jgi:hypothetical protein
VGVEQNTFYPFGCFTCDQATRLIASTPRAVRPAQVSWVVRAGANRPLNTGVRTWFRFKKGGENPGVNTRRGP